MAASLLVILFAALPSLFWRSETLKLCQSIEASVLNNNSPKKEEDKPNCSSKIPKLRKANKKKLKLGWILISKFHFFFFFFLFINIFFFFIGWSRRCRLLLLKLLILLISVVISWWGVVIGTANRFGFLNNLFINGGILNTKKKNQNKKNKSKKKNKTRYLLVFPLWSYYFENQFSHRVWHFWLDSRSTFRLHQRSNSTFGPTC